MLLYRSGEVPSSPLAEFESEGVHAHLQVDVQMRRSRNQVRLIVPGEPAQASAPQRNLSLIRAVTRAHAWYAKLLAGTASQASIAKENGVNDKYVSRLIRGAFLAPDITAAILDGRQPADLTLDALLENLSPEWAVQRQALGFA